jgi:hypothetical protein
MCPVSIDVGTMNVVGCRMGDNNVLHFNRVRNTFLDVDVEAKQMLKLRNSSFIEINNRCIIIGDDAVSVASIFNKNARRPMEAGVLSKDEDAQTVLMEIFKAALGAPHTEGEICYYSVPADPLDNPGMIVYHKKVLAKIIKSLGYTPIPKNEAYAICMSECAKEGFSGLTLSYGAGMCNIALTYATIPAPGLTFAITQSGDWIDRLSAYSIGVSESKVIQVKEKGVNLQNVAEGDPRDRKVREAIIFHYEQLIEFTFNRIKQQFEAHKGLINLPSPVPLVISGGTAKPKGFVEMAQDVLGSIDDFPIPISEVRLAGDPLTAVAGGLLVCALNH